MLKANKKHSLFDFVTAPESRKLLFESLVGEGTIPKMKDFYPLKCDGFAALTTA